jgi:hypothetical protein
MRTQSFNAIKTIADGAAKLVCRMQHAAPS